MFLHKLQLSLTFSIVPQYRYKDLTNTLLFSKASVLVSQVDNNNSCIYMDIIIRSE